MFDFRQGFENSSLLGSSKLMSGNSIAGLDEFVYGLGETGWGSLPEPASRKRYLETRLIRVRLSLGVLGLLCVMIVLGEDSQE